MTRILNHHSGAQWRESEGSDGDGSMHKCSEQEAEQIVRCILAHAGSVGSGKPVADGTDTVDSDPQCTVDQFLDWWPLDAITIFTCTSRARRTAARVPPPPAARRVLLPLL